MRCGTARKTWRRRRPPTSGARACRRAGRCAASAAFCDIGDAALGELLGREPLRHLVVLADRRLEDDERDAGGIVLEAGEQRRGDIARRQVEHDAAIGRLLRGRRDDGGRAHTEEDRQRQRRRRTATAPPQWPHCGCIERRRRSHQWHAEIIRAGGVEIGPEGSPLIGPYWGAWTAMEVAKTPASSQSARQMQRSARMSQFRVARGGLAWDIKYRPLLSKSPITRRRGSHGSR